MIWGIVNGERRDSPISGMRTECASSSFQFDFVMKTGWHPHPVVIFKKFDNRMRVSSGSHVGSVNWMGIPFGCDFFKFFSKLPLQLWQIWLGPEELVPSMRAEEGLPHWFVEGIGELHPVLLLLVVMLLMLVV